MSIAELTAMLKKPASMTSEARLLVFKAAVDGMIEEPVLEKFVRDFISGGASKCPALLLKDMAKLIIDWQEKYHAGEVDADGLPTY